MKKSYTTPSMKVHPVKITKILTGSIEPKNAQGNGVQLSNNMDTIIDDDDED